MTQYDWQFYREHQDLIIHVAAQIFTAYGKPSSLETRLEVSSSIDTAARLIAKVIERGQAPQPTGDTPCDGSFSSSA